MRELLSGGSVDTTDVANANLSPLALAAGIPLVDISAWMGHSLRAGGAEMNTTTRTYAHSTGESRVAALVELDAFVRKASGAFGQRATA
jgi:hypothetical protein